MFTEGSGEYKITAKEGDTGWQIRDVHYFSCLDYAEELFFRFLFDATENDPCLGTVTIKGDFYGLTSVAIGSSEYAWNQFNTLTLPFYYDCIADLQSDDPLTALGVFYSTFEEYKKTTPAERMDRAEEYVQESIELFNENYEDALEDAKELAGELAMSELVSVDSQGAYHKLYSCQGTDALAEANYKKALARIDNCETFFDLAKVIYDRNHDAKAYTEKYQTEVAPSTVNYLEDDRYYAYYYLVSSIYSGSYPVYEDYTFDTFAYYYLAMDEYDLIDRSYAAYELFGLPTESTDGHLPWEVLNTYLERIFTEEVGFEVNKDKNMYQLVLDFADDLEEAKASSLQELKTVFTNLWYSDIDASGITAEQKKTYKSFVDDVLDNCKDYNEFFFSPLPSFSFEMTEDFGEVPAYFAVEDYLGSKTKLLEYRIEKYQAWSYDVAEQISTLIFGFDSKYKEMFDEYYADPDTIPELFVGKQYDCSVYGLYFSGSSGSFISHEDMIESYDGSRGGRDVIDLMLLPEYLYEGIMDDYQYAVYAYTNYVLQASNSELNEAVVEVGVEDFNEVMETMRLSNKSVESVTNTYLNMVFNALWGTPNGLINLVDEEGYNIFSSFDNVSLFIGEDGFTLQAFSAVYDLLKAYSDFVNSLGKANEDSRMTECEYLIGTAGTNDFGIYASSNKLIAAVNEQLEKLLSFESDDSSELIAQFESLYEASIAAASSSINDKIYGWIATEAAKLGGAESLELARTAYDMLKEAFNSVAFTSFDQLTVWEETIVSSICAVTGFQNYLA